MGLSSPTERSGEQKTQKETELWKPMGAPMARTKSPCLRRSEFMNLRVGKPFSSIFDGASSDSTSIPTIGTSTVQIMFGSLESLIEEVCRCDRHFLIVTAPLAGVCAHCGWWGV